MKGQFLFLGTGGSAGIPMIGCSCPVCTSSDPHNNRLRPSGLVTIGGKRLLIDVGPDFRLQALRYNINTLDGVLLTHSHFDHVAGIDELRCYYLWKREPLPLLLSVATYNELKRRYDYLFKPKNWENSLPAQLDLQVFEEERGNLLFQGIDISYTLYTQAQMPVCGFRFGTFAYISDIRTYPPALFDDLRGVETLVVSALRKESSLMHFNVEEAVAFAQRVGARQTFLTHMCHELDHAATNALLPREVQLAHDGLTLEFVYTTL